MHALYVHICSVGHVVAGPDPPPDNVSSGSLCDDGGYGPSSEGLLTTGRVSQAPIEKPMLINGTPAVKAIKPIRKRRAKTISAATIEQQQKLKRGLV